MFVEQERYGLDILETLIRFAILSLFSFWISGIIHELGHIITGLLHGWKFWLLVVGPIGIKKDEKKLKAYFEKNPALWGGVGGTIPSDENVDNVKIWAKVLLAGPIASIVTGVIFLSFNFIHFSLAFVLLGAMPIAMGIACLLPFTTGITYTDGKRWARLRSEGQGRAEEISLFKMMMANIFEKDESTIEYDDFAPLLKAELPAIKYYGYFYLYRYYRARNDEENKLKALEELSVLKRNTPKIVVDDCMI